MRRIIPAVLSLSIYATGFAQVSSNYAMKPFTGGGSPLGNVAGTSANIGFSVAVTVDAAGGVYFNSDNVVYRLDPKTGLLSLVAGNGISGSNGNGGPATLAELSGPYSLAVDAAGNLYICDFAAAVVREVSNGVITTIAGDGVQGYRGDQGPATEAQLDGPSGIAVDAAGDVFIADTYNNRIRKVSKGIITTVVGNGTAGYSGDKGQAAVAELAMPSSIAIDSDGNLFIGDMGNNVVREVSTKGVITTIAGNGTQGDSGNNGPATSAELGLISSLIVDSSGDLFIADVMNCVIWEVTKGTITTIAGNGTADFKGDGGPATSAELNGPNAVALDSAGNLYIADTGNLRIREVKGGKITTIAGGGAVAGTGLGDGKTATNALLAGPAGLATDTSGALFLSDQRHERVREVSGGIIWTVAGVGVYGFGGDGAAPGAAKLALPDGVAVDGAGDVFIADQYNNRVREVVNGIISTVAGNGTSGFGGDGGSATDAQLAWPRGVAVDPAGNLYIADTNNNRIREVSNGTITTIAGNGTYGFSGDGGPAAEATLSFPTGIALDSSGNLYIADTMNNRVREISNGTISTIAGTGIYGVVGDGGPAAAAELEGPIAVAPDSSGNVFILDQHGVHEVSNGTITTIAQFGGATGLAVDGAGNVYVSDPLAGVVWQLTPSASAGSAGTGSTNTPPSITSPVNETRRVVLRGSRHPLARRENDRGAAPPDLPMERLMLLLRRSPAQDADLENFMHEQLDRTSPNFHHWLKPAEFGDQYGPSDQDIQAVINWLVSTGHSINKVGSGRTVIEFSGTAASVARAFQTEIHKYVINGKEHWANATEASIPEALAPAVAGVVSLNNFSPPRLLSGFSPANGACGYGSSCYVITPYDFAKIYDVLPLWEAGIDGTGQTIALINGWSNVNRQDLRDFRKLFGLPAREPVITLNGPDPGLADGEVEAVADITWSGAVAKGATIQSILTPDTNGSSGVDLSAMYAVDNNVAPIISGSYGDCELLLASENQFYSQLWQQAAAEGISVFISSGDSGSATCDRYGIPALDGLEANGTGATPYNVSVGGTDFTAVNPTSYWNTNNDPVTQASAKGYVPETTWNSTCTNADFSLVNLSKALGFTGTWNKNAETNCNNDQLFSLTQPAGGGGGPSRCIVSDGEDSLTCALGYPKPWWQAGPGVPKDGVRDTPDVSLFAAGFSSLAGAYYGLCESDLNPKGVPCDIKSPYEDLAGVGGTSLSAPAMAGIMALVIQKSGSRQGNPNPIFYSLAAQQSAAACDASGKMASNCVFHDVTRGTIAAPCLVGSPNCVVTNKTDFVGILDGYNAGPGYDLATGLGSVDAYNLVNAPEWTGASLTAAGISVGAAAGQGTLAVQACAGCTWTVSGAPDWVTITSASGTSSGSVVFSVTANDTGASRSGTITIAGPTFTIEQESTAPAALRLAGSMAQIASAGGWDTSLTLVNLGTTPSEARLNFFANDGSTPELPFTFPQQPGSGAILGSTFDQTLGANATLLLDTSGPASQAAVGSSELLTTGNVDGFAIFTYTPSGQAAVVPLETRKANSYLLAFDNTGQLVTGVAIANLAANAANVHVLIRNDSGQQIGTGSIELAAQGHASFLLTDPQQGFPVTANQRGTVEFDTPQGGQISVLGLRANGLALTSLPMLANVGTGGGTMAHVASGGGWQTVLTLVNTGSVPANATLKFFDDNGNALPLPLTFPQTGTTATESIVEQLVPAGGIVLIETQGEIGTAGLVGSAQLTTNGPISGFAIFEYTATGQEAVVPLATGGATANILAFDDTAGLATGIAVANGSTADAAIPVTLRDDTGATLATTVIDLPPNGHTSQVLTQLFPAAANVRGTVELDTPAGGRIAALGIRATPVGAYTTIPAMTR